MDDATLIVDSRPRLSVYVLSECAICRFAVETAAEIRRAYPHVRVEVIDLATTRDPVPDVVFATPTYLLDGRVWSLGNPSAEQIRAAFAASPV
jgi:hypothetical protein